MWHATHRGGAGPAARQPLHPWAAAASHPHPHKYCCSGMQAASADGSASPEAHITRGPWGNKNIPPHTRNPCSPPSTSSKASTQQGSLALLPGDLLLPQHKLHLGHSVCGGGGAGRQSRAIPSSPAAFRNWRCYTPSCLCWRAQLLLGTLSHCGNHPSKDMQGPLHSAES